MMRPAALSAKLSVSREDRAMGLMKSERALLDCSSLISALHGDQAPTALTESPGDGHGAWPECTARFGPPPIRPLSRRGACSSGAIFLAPHITM